MKQPLVILAGPTAVGKTELSIALAKNINGEIISADSMQVYKHMDIGSAKIMPKDMQGIRHHMIDVLEPSEEFHVVLFKQMVQSCIKDIYERGHVPILVGGTGFYIQAVLYDIDFTENEHNEQIRKELTLIAEIQGAHALHEMLRQVDEKSAQDIHENNVKRVIRAIEFYKLTGMKISEHNESERQKQSIYDSYYFVLNDDREKLYKNIDLRVEQMIEQGLVLEVKQLKEMGCTADMVSMQGLGYKEILAYLKGEISLERAVYLMKRDTRHFAKRQLTWFKREKNVIWIEKRDYGYDNERILAKILDYCTKDNLAWE